MHRGFVVSALLSGQGLAAHMLIGDLGLVVKGLPLIIAAYDCCALGSLQWGREHCQSNTAKDSPIPLAPKP
jgi:hypothetical protein